jgi:hypothetical protein
MKKAVHEVPVHHLLEQILDEYIVAAGLQSGQPLFQSVNSLGTAVTGRTLNRYKRLGCDSETEMKTKTIFATAIIGATALAGVVYAEKEGKENEQKIALTEMPPGVQKTIQDNLGGGTIIETAKEIKNGKTVYYTRPTSRNREAKRSRSRSLRTGSSSVSVKKTTRRIKTKYPSCFERGATPLQRVIGVA